MTDAAKSMERMRSVQESCHKAFSYVGDISTIANAKKFLFEIRFFDAFRASNDHFMKIGVSDIRRFETEARAHTLQFGQDLNHHIESVKASIQRWILMELLERERLTPRINLVASSSSSSSSALSPAPAVARLNACCYSWIKMRYVTPTRLIRRIFALPQPAFRSFSPSINATTYI